MTVAMENTLLNEPIDMGNLTEGRNTDAPVRQSRYGIRKLGKRAAELSEIQETHFSLAKIARKTAHGGNPGRTRDVGDSHLPEISTGAVNTTKKWTK